MTEKEIRLEILSRVAELYERPNLEQNSGSSGMSEQTTSAKSVVSRLGTGDRRQKAPILLVDDQHANLVSLEAVLKDLGQDVVWAKSGQEALSLVFDRNFAVILLDVRMPDMD